jgi:hypothetical protein
MACSLLVPREDEVEVLGVVDGVEHGENSAARVANCKKDGMSKRSTKISWPNVQIVLTPCRSIISWKISPPVFPMNLGNCVSPQGSGVRMTCNGETYDSSISLLRGLTSGWTWLRSPGLLALNAGLGVGRGLMLEES